MVFSIAAATARRRIALMARHSTQRRTMGGGPPPEWTGIDKVVRGTFPADYQLAMAILGGYSFLIGIFKIKGAISKKTPTKEIAAAPATASSDGSAMPSSDSPEFGEWLGSAACMKMIESA